VVSDPAQEVMFRDHVATALHIADRVGCLMLNALYGNTTGAEAADSQREVAWRNYEYARALAHRQGANILLETLNPHDNPRYPMTHLAQAAELVESLGGPAQGIGLLFDVYHVQRTEGDLIARFRAHFDNISHVQIADAPTRSAPGAGEVAFGPVLAAIADAGYDGYVGLEYHQSNAAEGFAWIANLSDGATPRAEGLG
jgi:hydroxypyruvate isomerase